jgi:hypothetical protein
MRYIAWSTILGFVLGLSGCVPSLHELYTEKDLIFEPALLGQWFEAKPDSKSTLTFIKSADKEYKLISADGKETSSVIAHLVKLGEKLFLDVNGDPAVDLNTSALPVHMFFLVSQTAPTLRMRSLDPVWLKEFLQKNPAVLKHEIVEKDVVLTASTKQLQSFVLRHVNTKNAFADPVDYLRKK